MNKLFSLLLIPFLFFQFNFKNSNYNLNFFDQKNQLSNNYVIKNLSLGSNSSGMIIDTDNDDYSDELYMWGYNNVGQIGDGTVVEKHTPIKITPNGQSDWGGNIISFSLGYEDSGAIIDTDLDGYADALYMWGWNGRGQLGDGTRTDRYRPVKITPNGQSDWGGNIIDLSLGDGHSGVTIDTDLDGYADTLYMWGYNNYGQLGNGTTESYVLSPIIITPDGQSNWGGNIIDLSLGDGYSGAIIDTDQNQYADTLYMWGVNYNGQLGDGTKLSKYVPTKITPSGQSDWGGNIIDLSLGDNHTGVIIDINSDGFADTLYMWGYNNYGQLGDGTVITQYSPKKITPIGQSDWGGNIIDLSLGSNANYSGVTIDTDSDKYADTTYMWGYNDRGQIGDGTTNIKYIPTKITPESGSWGGNIMDLSSNANNSGAIVDIDNDGFGDTLYMWGSNSNGQIGNSTSGGNIYKPIIVSSSYDFFLKNLEFYNTNHDIEINLTLNDYQNIISEAPEVILTDNDNNNYTTTFIESSSNINNDQYYYKLNDLLPGKNYNFTEITVNDDIFNIDENIAIDYLISDYTFASSTAETITIDLNLDQNSDNFDILNYSEDQRKIKVNYTNIDNNLSDSQEFTLDETNQITLTNLNAETNYRIDSIDYFYEDNNYKYTIDQEVKIFQTSAATPLINADSISLIENSITETSFEYTIEIDNLKENDNEDNFTQYDINNGIWLIDQDNQTYNSSFINERRISNGEINGTQNYQMTFLQEDLIPGETYNFTGIGFNDPNGSTSDIVDFSSSFEITTILVNKKFVDDTFQINKDSITNNSFEYTIEIDNLILIDNSQEKPIFSNFNLDESLYLKDQNNKIYSSLYIDNSALNLGIGEEDGTVKYQFSFKVNNLNQNTTYNFISLSFTNSFEESIDISEKGIITTNNNASEKIIIWVIIIVLIIFILLILILIWVDLKMKKKTKEITEKLNNYDA